MHELWRHSRPRPARAVSLPALVLLMAVLSTLLSASRLSADEVSLDLATRILLKVVLLDLDLEKKSSNQIVIGVVGSDEAFAAFATLKGQPIDREKQVIVADVVRYESTPPASALPTFLFVGRRADPAVVTAFTRKHDLLSVTTVDGYVEQGITLGLAVENQRPKVILNLRSSEAEGLRWNPKILKISRLIR